MKEVCTYCGFKCPHSLLPGELMDVTMTATFKRVEVLEVVVLFEVGYKGGRKKQIHKQKMMLL